MELNGRSDFNASLHSRTQRIGRAGQFDQRIVGVPASQVLVRKSRDHHSEPRRRKAQDCHTHHDNASFEFYPLVPFQNDIPDMVKCGMFALPATVVCTIGCSVSLNCYRSRPLAVLALSSALFVGRLLPPVRRVLGGKKCDLQPQSVGTQPNMVVSGCDELSS